MPSHKLTMQQNESTPNPLSNSSTREALRAVDRKFRKIETPQAAEARRQKRREADRRRKASETPEEAEARKQKRREADRKRRSSETLEAAEKRRAKRRVGFTKVLPANTNEVAQNKHHPTAQVPITTQTQHSQPQTMVVPTFNTPWSKLADPSSLKFNRFEQNPETAVILHHLNRGFLHYDYGNLADADEREKLIDQIRAEQPTLEEKKSMVSKYFFERPPLCEVFACGACGVKRPVQDGIKYHDTPLDSELLHILQLDAAETKQLQQDMKKPRVLVPYLQVDETSQTRRIRWKHIHPWKAKSIFVMQSVTANKASCTYFHLHPELVSKDDQGKYYTKLCNSCYQATTAGVRPTFSIASGVDFGDYRRIGLTVPNLMERHVLARVRLYSRIVKIQPNVGQGRQDYSHAKLRAHCIAFAHDAPIVASDLLDVEKLADSIRLHFIAPKAQMDRLIQMTVGTTNLFARGWVVYQWLAVLKHTSPSLYGALLNLPTLEKTTALLGKVNEIVLDNKMTSKDESTIRFEEAIGDDVAQVRSTVSHFGQPPVVTDADHSNPALNHSLLHTYSATTADSANTILQQTAEALQIKTKKEQKDRLAHISTRDEMPLNEFEQNDHILCGAFPHVFFLGNAYPSKKGLTSDMVRHLLLQFTNLPATCSALLFFLFNQQCRHQNTSSMAVRVRTNPKTFEAFATTVLSDEFERKMRDAMSDITSTNARDVIRTVEPVLRVAGKKTPFGAMESSRVMSHIYALQPFYKAPSTFLTIAFDDINNPTSFRCMLRLLNNQSFPAVASEQDIRAMIGSSKTVATKNFDIDRAARARFAANNPVATSLEFLSQVENIFKILLGVTPTRCISKGSVKVRTTYFMQNDKGLFGRWYAALGITEPQHRGALHMHLIGMGGLRPDLLQATAEFEDLTSVIADVMDNMYKAELDTNIHVIDLIHSNIPTKILPVRPPALLQRTLMGSRPSIGTLEKFATQVAPQLANVHKHTFTCKVGPNGKHGCRLGYKAGWSNKTQPKQLDMASITDDSIGTLTRIQPAYVQHVGPIYQPDHRVIAWELRRTKIQGTNKYLPDNVDKDSLDSMSAMVQKLILASGLPITDTVCTSLQRLDCNTLTTVYNSVRKNLEERNGYVVPFQPLLTAITASNTAAMMLGNSVQSKSAMFYICPYMGKNKSEIRNIISTLVKTKKDIIKHPSIAADRGTSKRTAQHWMTRLLNQLDTACEIVDTQVAACLLGHETETCTEQFQLVGIHECVNYVANELKGYVRNNNIEVCDGANCEDVHAKHNVYPEAASESPVQATFRSKIGPGTMYKTGNNITVVYLPQNYRFRGKHLRHLNRQEYYCLVKIVPKQESSRKTVQPGRMDSKRFDFGSGHPLVGTHTQVLRSKQLVPMYTGRPPAHPGKKPATAYKAWTQRADAFAAYWLTAFRAEPEIYDDTAYQQGNRLYYRWDDFCAFVSELETAKDRDGNKSFVCHARLDLMQSTIAGLKTSNEAKVALAIHRRRNRDPLPGVNHLSTREYGKHLTVRLDEFDNFVNHAMPLLTTKQISDGIKVTRYSRQAINIVETMHSRHSRCVQSSDAQMDGFVPNEDSLLAHDTVLNVDASDIVEAYGQCLQPIAQQDTAVPPSQLCSEISVKTLATQGQQLIDGASLQPSQRTFVSAVYRHLLEHATCVSHRHTPSIFFLSGPPGTGKTYVIKTVDRLTSLFSRTCVKTAFMGVAAVPISGATIQKFFNITNIPKEGTCTYLPLGHQDLEKLRERLGVVHGVNRLPVVIIEEAGMVTPSLLACVCARLQQATGICDDFGGVTVILVGDPNQLPPVKGTAFTDAAIDLAVFDHNTSRRMKASEQGISCGDLPRLHRLKRQSKKDIPDPDRFKPNSLYRKGTQLFCKATWYVLKEQVRSKDAIHTGFINGLSLGDSPDMGDLQQYKALTSKDLSDDPEWMFAPIIVATNRERFDLTESQAKAFAKHNKTHVVRWPVHFSSWLGQPPSDSDNVYDEDPVFWQYFVKGAEAFLTGNLNVEKGLANGTRVLCHSLTFATPEEGLFLQEQEDSLPYGSVITLHAHPLSYNVLVFPDIRDPHVRTQKIKHVTSLLICDDAVVPIMAGSHMTSWSDYLYVRGCPELGYAPSKVKIRTPFPVNLSFAMTVHKAQGRTLSKAILALMERPLQICQLSWSAVFVAFSRVQTRESIRFLLRDHRDYSALRYISDLVHPMHINLFLACCREGQCWNGDAAYDKFCAMNSP